MEMLSGRATLRQLGATLVSEIMRFIGLTSQPVSFLAFVQTSLMTILMVYYVSILSNISKFDNYKHQGLQC